MIENLEISKTKYETLIDSFDDRHNSTFLPDLYYSPTNLGANQGNHLKLTLGELSKLYLATLENTNTRESYCRSLNDIFVRGFLKYSHNLEDLKQENLAMVLLAIKNDDQSIIKRHGRDGNKEERSNNENSQEAHAKVEKRSIRTRTKLCSIFLSFISFLEIISKGEIKKPSSKQFKIYGVRSEKTVASILSRDEVTNFLTKLKEINITAYMIAVMQLQGGRRISECMSIKVDFIDFETGVISFPISKKRFMINKRVDIGFSLDFMNIILKYLLGRTSGFVFESKQKRRLNQPICKSYIVKCYDKAYKSALSHRNIRMSSHTLRASCFTEMFKSNVSVYKIYEVSAHSDIKTLSMYNKSDNLSVETSRNLNFGCNQ
jgi:integrase